MKDNKYFPYLVALAAISISFSAAFYSIFGIGKMFAGAATNVMVMAASLEFAKLVIASFLYRFWDDVNKALRTYLTIACGVLIIITSAGIYGFLSSAYQETANKVENVDKNTLVIEKKKEMIQKQLDQAEKQLELKSNRQNSLSDMRNRQQSNADNLIAQNKSVSSVRSQMNQLSKESKQLDDDIKILQDTIASKTQQIGELENQILDLTTNKDIAAEIGPLKYIAKLTGKTLDQVVNWFIIALMLVFDPLAIALVVASNFIFNHIELNKKKKEEEEASVLDEENTTQTEEEEITPIEEELQEVEVEESTEIPMEEVIEEQITEEPKFIIGKTPVVDKVEEREEVKEEPAIEEIVLSPDVEEIKEDVKEEEVKEEVEEIKEENETGESEEEGEFGGYKLLGNVYSGKKKPTSLKEVDDPKHIPIELLVTKGDPTRL